MLKQTGQIKQKQALQQRLSPQQLQLIRLLQVPNDMLEQHIKEELEQNPVLELEESEKKDDIHVSLDEQSEGQEDMPLFHEDESDYLKTWTRKTEDYTDLPEPYRTTFTERLEAQVKLLGLDNEEQLLADEIIGSIDSDGYLRRSLDAIIDAVAFNDGVIFSNEKAGQILHQIQRLDPPGIAARNLRECLLIQLEGYDPSRPGIREAIEILEKAWPLVEKNRYETIRKKLNLSDGQLKRAYKAIQQLNPKPGEPDETTPSHFIVPDFTVHFDDTNEEASKKGGKFVIRMNKTRIPSVKISQSYLDMYASESASTGKKDQETLRFIGEKINSARFFIESIRQRENTLMAVMKAIVSVQEEFCKTGKKLKPMILKDIANMIGMDISTVSRAVNGKYVQLPFGVYELKYFFSEGMESESGEVVSNREIKDALLRIIAKEEKASPMSDEALANALGKEGYRVARRTVSKYRKMLKIPAARYRREHTI